MPVAVNCGILAICARGILIWAGGNPPGIEFPSSTSVNRLMSRDPRAQIEVQPAPRRAEPIQNGCADRQSSALAGTNISTRCRHAVARWTICGFVKAAGCRADGTVRSR